MLMYARFFKRPMDFMLALIALIVLSPLLLVLTVVGAVMMRGNPFFIQPRPGKRDKNGQEKIFYLIKLRTMSNERGPDGELLPDAQRLNRYGALLRKTSIDELPSLINVLKGDLSLCGPRPQLVSDMCFMSEEQRRRHDVRPGITGFAQINGRNNISWEQKLDYDLQYIDNGITFIGDVRIMLKTIVKVLKRSDTVREGTVSDVNFGDVLLAEGKIDKDVYRRKQDEARQLLNIWSGSYGKKKYRAKGKVLFEKMAECKGNTSYGFK